MTRLSQELLRLYAVPADTHTCPVGRDGEARVLVLGLAGPLACNRLSTVWQGVQDDWGWPAPALAINGVDGFELWFSLAQGVTLVQAQMALQTMCQRYLPDAEAALLHLWPGPAASTHPVPPALRAPEQWSAFVSPGMATVFAEEPWLNVSPNADQQADLLASLQSVGAAAWARCCATLAHAEPEAPAPVTSLGARTDWTPRLFLQAVMNDPSAPLAQRIEAAKALLPDDALPPHAVGRP